MTKSDYRWYAICEHSKCKRKVRMLIPEASGIFANHYCCTTARHWECCQAAAEEQTRRVTEENHEHPR